MLPLIFDTCRFSAITLFAIRFDDTPMMPLLRCRVFRQRHATCRCYDYFRHITLFTLFVTCRHMLALRDAFLGHFSRYDAIFR